MEWPVTVVKNLSFSRLEAGACLIGNDLLVGIKGGDLHHIGTGGFHVDGITKEQIREVLSAADTLSDDLAAALMALL